MSALSQASDLLAQRLGNVADSFESSECPQQSLGLLTMRFEVANYLAVSLHLAAGSSGIKPLRNAVPCNGCMRLKELPISL